MHLSPVRTNERRGGRTTSTLRVPGAVPRAALLKAIAKAHPDRDAAMRAAWATGEYSYAQIAAHFGVHFTTVGRAVRKIIQTSECEGMNAAERDNAQLPVHRKSLFAPTTALPPFMAPTLNAEASGQATFEPRSVLHGFARTSPGRRRHCVAEDG